MTRTGKTYVIMTSDGVGYDRVFLSWDSEGGYYTTVDCLDEINEFDFHSTIESAISRAEDADSGTFGGWPSPMVILEVLNIEDALNGMEPEFVEVRTLTF